MSPEQVLTHPVNVLTESQRAFYFNNGYLVLPNYVPAAWLDRLRKAMGEMLDQSRAVTESNKIFVLEEGHTAQTPRLHRVTSPQDQHPTFWEFITDPLVTDVVADVVGPDVKFHHAKLNVKAGDGTRGFKWHQDIQSYPHTDYSSVTFGVYIDGCDADQGPLQFVPGSHAGKLYSMYDRAGNFVVHAPDDEISWLSEDMIDTPTGGPGTAILLNCRTLHGSAINRSTRSRPLLLQVFSSADSFPYTVAPVPSQHLGDVVRGKPAKYACFDLRPCEMPPDWRGGYRSPWAYQKEEDEKRKLASNAAE